MVNLTVFSTYIIKIDPSNDTDMQSGIDEIIANHGRIDLLINVTGFALSETSKHLTAQEEEYRYRSNLVDWARFIELSLPYMKQQKSGKIINIVSAFQKNSNSKCQYFNAGRKFVKVLNIKIREKPEAPGVTNIRIDASHESESSIEKNQTYSSYLFSKFSNKIESIKMSFLKKIMVNGQEDEVLADLLLELVSSPNLGNVLEKKIKNIISIFSIKV